MREIVLDTETTGFEPAEGHRIVEIGAVELINHIPSGKNFHEYLNPDRSMPKEAFEVHGLGDDFLRGKPRFREVAQKFLDFIGDAKLIIHNAAFDMKFLNAELQTCGLAPLPYERAVDTLMMARKRFPGSPASLDALCRRFSIDHSKREKHGALLDSEILAEVYLELIGGRQPDFGLDQPSAPKKDGVKIQARTQNRVRPKKMVSLLTPAEEAAHRQFVEKLGQGAIWLKRS